MRLAIDHGAVDASLCTVWVLYLRLNEKIKLQNSRMK
jgi:hypothetical protein